jgi:hypothetical protein
MLACGKDLDLNSVNSWWGWGENLLVIDTVLVLHAAIT